MSHANRLGFRRDAFSPLQREVIRRLKMQLLSQLPVLVSGQSGSGKSTALADLAVSLRRRGWPVFFFSRNETNLDSGLIDNVCQYVEKLCNRTILLIWDAARDVETYTSLAGYFALRGRKVLVLGSIYGTAAESSSTLNLLELQPSGTESEDEPSQSIACIEFTDIMSHREASRFHKYLQEVDPRLVEEIDAELDFCQNWLVQADIVS